ncbi:hypothetical protein M0802_001530 [Mischocyttarus mexicanus]|nr:hypothetical protein M0802_001530 [Mischocyttarus mexicanus]
MTSRRRTFHLDWDSPSHETGTVKRRPASIGVSLSCTKNHFDNVEYYGYDNPGNSKSVNIVDNNCECTKFERNENDDRIVRNNEQMKKNINEEEISNGRKSIDSIGKVVKTDLRTGFDLKLSSEKTLESRSKSFSIRNIASTRGITKRSLIPRSKITRPSSSSGFRGLVNSSSDSSGIGSPLSPLSPQRDSSTIDLKEIPKNIKPSESNSSGLGSPDSSLSPDSQTCTEYYLIQQQQHLEKYKVSCKNKIQQVKIANQNLDCTTIKKSPRRSVQLEDRQISLNSSNRSPRRRELSFTEDFVDQDETMSLSYDFYSRNADNEPCLSFLKFESLYTMEKQMLMQPQHCIPRLDGKDVFLGSRQGLYTELPSDSDTLIQQRQYHHHQQQQQQQQQIGPIGPANKLSSQFPMEGFSYAPGWALNADHFYQWQHRGKTTQQVVEKVVRTITKKFLFATFFLLTCDELLLSKFQATTWFIIK